MRCHDQIDFLVAPFLQDPALVSVRVPDLVVHFAVEGPSLAVLTEAITAYPERLFPVVLDLPPLFLVGISLRLLQTLTTVPQCRHLL